MKTFLLVLVLAVLTSFRAAAQVSVEITMDQEQFLPSEAVPVAVKITNRSGQQLHLGAAADWLTFSVESTDGFIVIKNAEVPVTGEFDLESSQIGIKRVDLQPYFQIGRHGRYKVIATLRIKDWSASVNSAPKTFDVVNGAKLWSQDFGVPGVTNSPPEVRKFTLEEANYLRLQLRLYVRVSDQSESQVFKVTTLGQMVSFSDPDAKVDRTSQLHVLWQAGAQVFNYALINANGEVVRQEVYNNAGSRPRLVVNEQGEVSVAGGTRRVKPEELPVVPVVPWVKAPGELPAKNTKNMLP
ncbi:MAG TPA: hypothetical protein DCQ92_09195 [Verrucomicrobia subdivision 3 bacterium]|nr:hypothetical protein [Limisphaerales bacterium]